MKLTSSLTFWTRTFPIDPTGARWLPFVVLKPNQTRIAITATAAANVMPNALDILELSDEVHQVPHRVVRFVGGGLQADLAFVVLTLELFKVCAPVAIFQHI